MSCEPQKINILMVDDNLSNLLALESILQAPDRNLVRATSGDEALRYLLDCDVAVILLDVYMPGIDGLETAALIRGREKSRDIPIIFITADSTGNRHIARGYSLGAVDYILKPVEPDILRSKVAVFVELFKKTEEIKQQAELLHEKNLQLEEANLERLGKLIELGQQLAAERDPLRVLEKFCHAARDIIGARHAGVGMLDTDGQTLLHNFHSDLQAEAASRNGSPQVSQDILNLLLTARRPLRLNETSALLDETNLASPAAGVSSLLGAPIFSSAQIYGWLCLTGKIGADEFSEADERLAVTLATQVAVAYENAMLYTEAQRHATELQQEVAERKQAEEERARLLVREQAARAEAERANLMKDEFLATLSHELRTPLTAILGWIHLIRTNKLDEDNMLRALDTIERNAQSQKQLIDDILDVSRIITGKLKIDYEPVDLTSIIEATVDTVRPATEAKSLSVQATLDQGSCLVSGDANRLQQVVWNLFSNAIKFTPDGGKVQIRLAADDSHAELTISDTGIGINPAFLPHIFDRFRQADGTTTRKHGGLGLGLAIVRHLVELHGGTIKASSEGEGKGSTFVVKLPLAAPRVNRAPETEQTQQADKPCPPLLGNPVTLKGLRILVVDDEFDTRELIAAVLSQCGAEVRHDGTVEEAILTVESWSPHLVLSDIGMPEEDGYSLIKRMRELDPQQPTRIPVIALTAYAGAEDRQRALDAGFQLHIAKPIEPEELVAAVARLAQRSTV
ncbi:MAG TPA: response regulator [Pyrinomonadaceae bacterium]|jgi:signal transduction histidine kinase